MDVNMDVDKREEAMILIVDDTETFIDIVIETLGNQYQFCVCTSGEHVLETAVAEQPDLILLDILMPGMDGYEVCQQLKANVSTKDIPVIFLTVKTDVEDERKGFALGAVDYITKPISPPILEARVKTQLEIRTARVALEEQNRILKESVQLREDMEVMTRHDLKSPLTAVIGCTQLLLMNSQFSQDDRGLLQNIEGAAYSILEMINRSLDRYKMEKGLYPYEPVAVNVHQIIDRIMLENKAMMASEGKAIDIVCEAESDACSDCFMVQAEELLSYSMLSNLIKNALEAAPSNSTISIVMGGKDTPFISIHNMGAVPKAIRESLFDKHTTMGKPHGTGLGAYSARLIADTQGGSIQLETSDATGTTVTVKFSTYSNA